MLDTKPYGDLAHRAWAFRTVGYGHEQLTWRWLVSALRLVGYDDVLSTEHEDPWRQSTMALAERLLS